MENILLLFLVTCRRKVLEQKVLSSLLGLENNMTWSDNQSFLVSIKKPKMMYSVRIIWQNGEVTLLLLHPHFFRNRESIKVIEM